MTEKKAIEHQNIQYSKGFVSKLSTLALAMWRWAELNRRAEKRPRRVYDDRTLWALRLLMSCTRKASEMYRTRFPKRSSMSREGNMPRDCGYITSTTLQSRVVKRRADLKLV